MGAYSRGAYSRRGLIRGFTVALGSVSVNSFILADQYISLFSIYYTQYLTFGIFLSPKLTYNFYSICIHNIFLVSFSISINTNLT